jgi:hypothetical protein
MDVHCVTILSENMQKNANYFFLYFSKFEGTEKTVTRYGAQLDRLLSHAMGIFKKKQNQHFAKKRT